MSFIRAGISMMVYAFLIMIIYFTISPFTTPFFDTFSTGNFAEATGELHQYTPMYSTIFNIAIALAVAIAPTWFIIWVFKREDRYDPYRRY